jgi:hypothetical protein
VRTLTSSDGWNDIALLTRHAHRILEQKVYHISEYLWLNVVIVGVINARAILSPPLEVTGTFDITVFPRAIRLTNLAMTIQNGERGGYATIVVFPGCRPSTRRALVRRDVAVYVLPDIDRVHRRFENFQPPGPIIKIGALDSHERSKAIPGAVAFAQ